MRGLNKCDIENIMRTNFYFYLFFITYSIFNRPNLKDFFFNKKTTFQGHFIYLKVHYMNLANYAYAIVYYRMRYFQF